MRKFGVVLLVGLFALAGCKEYPPQAEAVNIAVQAADSVTVTANWTAVTDPQGGSLQYLWENRRPDGTIFDSSTTGFTSTTTSAERDWSDANWTFCVVTQRVEDNLTSPEKCQTYVVPKIVAVAPPAVDSITITVE